MANLKSEFLRLLREDEEFRLAAMALLGYTDLRQSIDRLVEAVNELVKIVKSHEMRLAKVEERLSKVEERVAGVEERLDRLGRAVEELVGAMRAFDRRLTALGVRWGVESEEAFRNAMRGVVEEILGTAVVEKWRYFDREGVVYGHPSQIDVDLVVKDGVHILVEVKASASSGDVLELFRIGQLYEAITGVKPRLVLVTPYIDDRGLRKAKKLGVEVYSAT